MAVRGGKHAPEVPPAPNAIMCRMESGMTYNGGWAQFYYKGQFCAKFWDVPIGFEFPSKTTRFLGWKMWLQGKSVMHEGTMKNIKPFRLLEGKFLPNKRLSTDLFANWHPIFRKMQEAPGFSYPASSASVDDEFVRSSYELCTNHLRETVSYIWKKATNEGRLNGYTLGTWCKYVSRNQVEKYGTAEDIAHLPPPTARNKKDSKKRGGWSIEKRGVRLVATQTRKKPRNGNDAEIEAQADELMDALGIDMHRL